jgi:cobalt-precorrin-5B (C1)-methyltransferase
VNKKLRTGFTTGSAATAAAKAALRFLLKGERLSRCDIPLPAGGRLDVPVAGIDATGESGALGQVRAVVVKDGGDDPDVTHEARISCLVALEPDGPPEDVIIEGGAGVGRATLPGLPVAVGKAAINPGPMRQIREAVLEETGLAGYAGAVRVLVEVENGEALAQKTMNPRLGILGGVSILGESGIVIPYSLESWKAAISEGLDVARAMNLDAVILTTGRRSERFHMERFPGLAPQAYVQAADFFAFSLKEAAARDFGEIVWSCFFGKLVKMAMAMEYTHARSGEIDFDKLAAWAAETGLPSKSAAAIADANTARHVLEISRNELGQGAFVARVCREALNAARSFAGPGPRLCMRVFDFDGELLDETYAPDA